jgi:hypothetical protein
MRPLGWLLVATLCGGALPARGAAASGEASVDKVLKFFHVEKQFGTALDDVKAAMAKRRKELTIAEQRVTRIEQLAGRIYRPKNLMKVFKVAYAKNTTLEAMTAFYKWTNTVKGIKLRSGLDAAYLATPATRQALFDKDSPAILKPNRRNAIQTFIQTSEQTTWKIRAKAGAALAIFKALNAYLPAGTQESDPTLKEKADGRGEGHREAILQELLVFDFYTFKSAKNEEIDEWAKFFATAVGQATTKALIRALDLTMERAATTLAAEVAKAEATK